MSSTVTTNPSAAVAAAEALMYKRRWVALGLLSLSLVLVVMDSTIVNIAFPSLRATFGASFADAEWVNSIYSLVFGAALITWGKLGDQYGRRNIFILGTLVFMIGSTGTGFAPSIGSAVFFRAVQGMGGAMLSPSTLSIISGTFKGRERGIAFGVWGATAGMAAALGPIIGGWLIEYGTNITAESWRLAFLINIPIALVAIAGSFWAIREARDNVTKHHIDWLGIVLVSLSVGSLVFGAIEGQNYGWLEAKDVFSLGPITYPVLAAGVTTVPAGTPSFIPFIFLFGAVMFALFVWVERRQEANGGEPLFEFGLLRYPSFRYGLMTVLIVALGEFGVVLILSIYFQLAKGLGAFETGLRFLPFALTVIVAAPMAGGLSSRFGAKWVVTIGMMSEAVALFWISSMLTIDLEYSTLVPAFMLYGIGVGLAIAQLANIVLSDIPADKAGVASGANNTVRQLGASLGIAIVGAVLFGSFASEAKPLIASSTAFDDFGARVAENQTIAPASKTFGAQIATFGSTVKEQIEEGLDANEGFEGNTDVIDQAIANIPAIGKIALKAQGVDLDNPEVVAQIRTDLAPDAAILASDIQHALGTGFSSAGRSAGFVAAVFVAFGALSSLLLPNARRKPGEQGEGAPVMAH